MRTAKSLGLLLFVALSNAALIYGCSSDDADPIAATEDGGGDATKDGTSITAEGGEQDASTDAKKDSKADAKKDTSTNEGGGLDATPDVAIVYEPEGAPCGPLNRRETRPCGLCGKQERICLKATDAGADSGGDAGLPGIWYPWGACVNGAGAVCDPTQTYPDEACGNCGTRQRICQIDCTYVQGLACGNEGECKAGSTDWEEGLGCQLADGGLYGRNKTCTAQCQYDIATSCSAPPPNPNFINVTSAAVGGTFSKQFTFDAAIKQKKLETSFNTVSACPLAGFSTTQSMYVYVEVKNTTASNLKVSIYHSDGTAPNGEDDTIMALYSGAAVPRTDSARLNCLDYVADGCDSTIGGTFNPKGCQGFSNTYAGIIKGEELASSTYGGVTLNAGQSVTVYLAAYSSVATAGNVKLNVRVE